MTNLRKKGDHLLNEVDEPRSVLARSGKRIDTSRGIWILDDACTINIRIFDVLPSAIAYSARTHIRYLIENHSPAYVQSQAGFIAVINRDPVVRIMFDELSEVGFVGPKVISAFIEQVRLSVSAPFVPNYLDAFRRFYTFCTDQELDGWDADVANGLDRMIIGNNPKGEAVLRQDPTSGPLNRQEEDNLVSALENATNEGSIPDVLLAVVWLMLAYGCNPRALSLLDEDDLIETKVTESEFLHELRLPRVKKRLASPRDHYRTRPLDSRIAKLLKRVILENRRAAAGHSQDKAAGAGPADADVLARPLFRTANARASLADTAFASEQFRVRPTWFGPALAKVVAKLNVLGRDGEPLHVAPRRLRYSFATRLVREGCSPLYVADALDHSSTSHVMVYFDVRSDAVEALDKALALKLAPMASAMMPSVTSEDQAVRGNDPASRIKFIDLKARLLLNVGTCGSFDWCGLNAPKACYVCSKFQAWRDGPHEFVLEKLIEERDERLARGSDIKWTANDDQTIFAVAAIVKRCREMGSHS